MIHNLPEYTAVWERLILTYYVVGAIVMVFFCARVGHEKWQLTGFMIIQTALIGSMASVGIHDKAQAITVVVIAGAAITAPQLVSFTMLSLGLDDQTDM